MAVYHPSACVWYTIFWMFPDNTTAPGDGHGWLKWTDPNPNFLVDRLENQPRRLQNSTEPCCLVTTKKCKMVEAFREQMVSKSEGNMMNAQCQLMPMGYKCEKLDVLIVRNWQKPKTLQNCGFVFGCLLPKMTSFCVLILAVAMHLCRCWEWRFLPTCAGCKLEKGVYRHTLFCMFTTVDGWNPKQPPGMVLKPCK